MLLRSVVRLLMTGALLPAGIAWANSGGIIGYSGNPESLAQGEICTVCHTDTRAKAPVVHFEGPTQVTVGSTVTFSFFVQSQAKTTQKFAGLDVSADEGQLLSIVGQGTQKIGGEITHTARKTNDTNGIAQWDFMFQAPLAPINVILYGAGNSVNGDGSQLTGDRAAATTFSFDVIAAVDSPTPTDTPTPTSTATLPPTPSPSATTTLSPTISPTPLPTRTVTFGPSPTPTATRVPGSCVGDCDNGGTVSVDELVVAVRIALGTLTPDFCTAADADHDGRVLVDELVLAVNAALNGCPESGSASSRAPVHRDDPGAAEAEVVLQRDVRSLDLALLGLSA